MRFEVRLEDEGAAQKLRSLPPQVRKRLKQGLALLAEDPYATSKAADIKRLDLDRRPPAYRLRVGPWRIVYVIHGAQVQVIRIMHREEGYDWLE